MTIPEILNIKIDHNDIFDYVVKNTLFHPIERHVDPTQYLIYEESIFNTATKEVVPQNQDYKNFFRFVQDLKQKSANMEISEIVRLCEQLEDIAPKTVNL